MALATLLTIQLLALAVQVKRQTAEGSVRLIRMVTVDTVAAFERLMLHTGGGVRGVWANYLDLRHVRQENLRLKAESGQMLLERAREQEEVRQARRLQSLLEFKQHWVDATVAAQVIGTSGTETSRLIYLDKGVKDGIRADMPVITPDGVVGKVLSVFGDTAQVLMINDASSGVGAILVNSRLQGIVKGTPTGGVQLRFIMGDEPVQSGDTLVTSGGDRVFPKGLALGKVARVSTGRDLFLEIQVKPAVDLDRLEEVLVITEQKMREPDAAGAGPVRASDILAEHLPGVPVAPPADATPATPGGTAPKPSAPPNKVQPNKIQAIPAPPKPVQKPVQPKPVQPKTEQPKAKPLATGGSPRPAAAAPKPATGAKPATGVKSATSAKPTMNEKPAPSGEGTRPQ